MAALVSAWIEQSPPLLLTGLIAISLLLGWLLGCLPQRMRRLKQVEQQQLLQQQIEQQLSEQAQQLQQLSEQNTALQVELSGSRERIQGLQRLEAELTQRDQQLQSLRQEHLEQQTRLGELQAQLQAEQRHHVDKLAMLEQSGEKMVQQFRALGQQIFEDNSRKFGSQQQEKIQHLLQPLRDQLGDFRRRVDDVYDKEARDRQGLAEQINQLKQLNLQMSEDAVNLTNALKGENKTQGNWGELVLERVLEESGLRRGYEYELQFSTQNEEGRRLQPDVIIHLPDRKDIVVDSKVSLIAYERYCSSDDEAEREAALREHLLSVKRHIKGLSDKGYESLKGVRSLDFVLLFIPVEAAFLTAIEQDRSLFGDAFERNILLVSPSTLLVTLRTINNIWRYEKQNANAQEIAKRGGELYDKFVGFVAAMEDVGKYIDQSRRSYETAMGRLSTGKGNLVNRATALKKLGVRAKKDLPEALVEGSDSDIKPTITAPDAVEENDLTLIKP
ncbi:DNA recombination protein RmuC [Motiliproteus sp.]|uniref:DNA recombination protein RmuC n=1 Tax=Motiliproteus sp. TaxID=1898955 RepID=UPI003BA8FF9D